jgi:hypothetical protein
MPFVVKDVLQHKRNDRQIREIHEREYSKYLANLRQEQQRQNSFYSNQYYLSSKHINEIERTRSLSAMVKQNHYARIERENHALYGRLLQASKRAMIDDQNRNYQQNLEIFNSKHIQQRFKEYKRIENDNHLLLQRLNNARGHLISKQQCEKDWKKHLQVMKQNCDYPEKLDQFVSKMTKNQQQKAYLDLAMRSARWNDRHGINEPTMTPLAFLLKQY